jgi:iron complex outermembrane receptor protein
MQRQGFGRTKTCLLIGLWGVLGFFPISGFPAAAGEIGEYQLETMTVTAEKREDDVQKVPGAISVLSDVQIEDGGIVATEDLSRQVPNLQFNSVGSRRHGLMYMRGIKSIPKGEPATGLYIDGVGYAKSFMFDYPLFDVERIEVLRGPQGTLYGRNTMGGVINVHTKQPGNETSAHATATYGSYNLQEVKGSWRFPLIEDRVFVGISGVALRRDGFTDNDTEAHGRDGCHREGEAGRMHLRFLPSKAWDVTVSLDGQHHDDGAYPYRRTARNALVRQGILAKDRAFHYSHDYEGSQQNDYWGASLKAVHILPAATVTSITAYRDYDSDEKIDSDFSPYDMKRTFLLEKEETVTQEFRIASPEQARTLKWIGGIYGFHIDAQERQTNVFRAAMAGSPANPFGTGTGARTIDTGNENNGYALFGQVSRTFFGDLELTFGLRYEYEKAETKSATYDTPDGGATVAVGTSRACSNDFTALLPKFAATWHWSRDHMTYVSVARAHRSGGFNDSAAPAGDYAYDEEHSWHYEAGVKSTWLDNRLVMNVAVFYIDLEDEQVALFNAATNKPYLKNAGESHRLGVETEVRFRPLAGLDLIAGCGWIEAQYDKYRDTAAGVDYKGNHVVGVPEYTYHVGLQYRHALTGPWSLFGRMDLEGVGARYWDDGNSVRHAPYELVHLRLGIEGEHADLHFWVKNLFDKEYQAFENTAAGLTQDGPPLTLGLSLTARY